MKQVLQARSGSKLTFVAEVPAPPCPPGGMLVKNEFSIISSGTERSRIELSQKSLVGKARERPDLVREVMNRARREGVGVTRRAVQRRLQEVTAVGYSSAGYVIEIGEHARGFQVGDRVACGGAGHANHAEVVAVPTNLCAKVPDGVSLRTAAFATIAAIALHAIRLADVRLGEKVAVVGCGLVGQIAVRLLACGGTEVFALDIDPRRVDDALAGGAAHGVIAGGTAADEVRRLTVGRGVDEAIVTAAAADNRPLLSAAEMTRDRGTVVLVGAVPIEFPRSVMYDKELSFRVSRSYGPGRYDAEYEERGLDYPIGYVRWTEKRNMEAVLELVARRRLWLEDLIDDVLPVDRAAEAYDRLVADDERRPRGAITLYYPPIADPAEPAASGNGRADSPSGPAGRPAAVGTGRVGLIGPGAFATRAIIPALVDAGATLEVVGGGAGPSAIAACRESGFDTIAESAEAVIADERVDAVVICTRHASHADLTVAALRAGKNVFVEKPLALTEAELDEVMTAARESAGILLVGFNRRFSPALRRVRDFVVAEGGPVTGVYRVAAGRLPSDHWAHDLAVGGGRVLGEGCHFIDSLAFVAGSPIVQVHAMGHGSPEAPAQAWDNVVVTMRMANGSTGTLVYVADGSPRLPKERLEVFCGRRASVLDDYVSLDLLAPSGAEHVGGRTQDKGHRQEIASFLAGVRSGTPPVALNEIENTSLATLAAVESLRTGRAVKIG